MTIEKAKESYLERNNFTEMSPKAVFFDMDGVLFDSMPHHSVAWVKAMNESGLEFSEHEAYMNEGQTGTATINSVFVLKTAVKPLRKKNMKSTSSKLIISKN